MKKLFRAASGVFGALPGVAIIVKGIGTPPDYNWLFGGVIEALGALSLILLFVNRMKIKRFSDRKVTRVAIILAIVFFASLICYTLLFEHCVVTHPARGTAYYPLCLDGEIAEMVESAGSRFEAIERYGIAGVVLAIGNMGGAALTLTTILLLSIYQAVFTSLTLAFGIAGFHEKQSF